MNDIPVFCRARNGLYWVGDIPDEVTCGIEWVSRFTGIDPDNVKAIERQAHRWLITLVVP